MSYSEDQSVSNNLRKAFAIHVHNAEREIVPDSHLGPINTSTSRADAADALTQAYTISIPNGLASNC